MLKPKKKVLIFIDWFLPGYKAGGPIKSVHDIIKKLNDHFDFYIVTSDRDFGDQHAYTNILLNQWIDQGSFRIIYLSKGKRKRETYKNIILDTKPDLIYLNSIFSVYFTILPLITLKLIRIQLELIIAPRGMLGKGALAIKPFKKRLFLFLSKQLGLFNKVIWHASSEYETKEIQNVFGKQSKVRQALNIIEKPIWKFHPKTKEAKELKLFFLSRISSKKNLLYALECLSQVGEDITLKVEFDIYGPIEDDNYWKDCCILIGKMPIGVCVHYKGAIVHEELKHVLPQYHFLFLPTLNENFGHVILESFSFGCPVITSNQTPWRNLKEKNIGWDISLKDRKEMIDVIQYAANMDSKEYNLWSEASYLFYCSAADEQDIIDQNLTVFSGA